MSDAIKPIVMPKWGLAMQEGMVAKWLVEEGAEISGGDEILDIETSKIANVYESPVAGPLRRRLVGEGETVPVGALLGVVADSSVSDADLDAFVARFQEEFAAHAAEASAAAPEPETIEAGGRRFRYLALGEGEGRRSSSSTASAAISTTGSSTRKRWPRAMPPTPSTCPATAARARIWVPAMSTSGRWRRR